MRKISGKVLIVMLILSIVIFISIPCYGNGSIYIYGCAKKGNGQLRIVENPTDCNPTENLISWRTIPNLYQKGCVKDENNPENYTCSCNVGDMLISGGAYCELSNEYLTESYISSWPWAGTWSAVCVDKDGNYVPPEVISIVCMIP
jgi:hypothetical protein